MPLPANKRVTWSWLPEDLPIVDAGKLLLFPHEPLVIHEGWLEMGKKEAVLSQDGLPDS